MRNPPEQRNVINLDQLTGDITTLRRHKENFYIGLKLHKQVLLNFFSGLLLNKVVGLPFTHLALPIFGLIIAVLGHLSAGLRFMEDLKKQILLGRINLSEPMRNFIANNDIGLHVGAEHHQATCDYARMNNLKDDPIIFTYLPEEVQTQLLEEAQVDLRAALGT